MLGLSKMQKKNEYTHKLNKGMIKYNQRHYRGETAVAVFLVMPLKLHRYTDFNLIKREILICIYFRE